MSVNFWQILFGIYVLHDGLFIYFMRNRPRWVAVSLIVSALVILISAAAKALL